MTLAFVMPDTTKLTVAFLRAQPEVTALLGAPGSVRGKLQKDTVYPAVRVFRVSSEIVVERPFTLEMVRVQLDCYGGNNRQAERLAQTVRSALAYRMPGYMSDGGQVARVTPFGMSDLIDEEFTPPKDRYIVEMDIYTRALG